MSSILNGTANVLHKTKLPAGATREQGVAMLHDHAFYLSCDPHLVKQSELKPDDARVKDAAPPPPPERVASAAVAGRARRFYEVHDLVHNLPGGLWDSNVVSTNEITDIEAGLFVRIRSPMAVVMDTFWEIRAVEGEEGAWELVEEITISASRLIVGLVKSLCEGGWEKIHEKMMERLKAELAAKKAAA
ncbi:hypothetical protein GGTG_05413 [Gaeumannomyces tritici R3-111a-1]|uniref:DUF7053 domain-containing protein n=1 Tax=Gaeumannomyces tritici (strain R3-111a-1) TaxID=644352 RepID=J3NVV1_GAET3|nr:hypothetical protein GGTG_05413 [Gaeumannomyces tritici R3-111a-1]EJT75480.1 hypothetical protein GGTG_05413 [Gaeumannomyces tritici R3-111a-1]